jgi:hypothetical protein
VSDCTAVGSTEGPIPSGNVGPTLAEHWNGSSWTVQAAPSHDDGVLNAVSCVQGICMAVGYDVAQPAPGDLYGAQATLAELWNGSAWSVLSTPALPSEPNFYSDPVLNGVSCVSARHCVAVGSYVDTTLVGHAVIEIWDGTSWSQATVPQPSDTDQDVTLNAVSCTTATTCTAVGGYGQVGQPFAEQLSGSGWSLQTVPGGYGLTGVSCVDSGSFCAAVGASGGLPGPLLAETRVDGTWSVDPTPDTGEGLSAVSCTGPSACVAVGAGALQNGPQAMSWDGRSWSDRSPAAPAGALYSGLGGVSCPAAGGPCVAVGTQEGLSQESAPLAESLGSAGWSPQSVPRPSVVEDASLTAVSCATSGLCAAVERTPSIGISQTSLAVRRGGIWSLTPAPSPAGAVDVFSGVACWAQGQCMAVGSDESNHGFTVSSLAELWNGSSWRIVATTTVGALASVSCVSAADCAAVGGGAGWPALFEHWNGSSWTVQTVPAGLDGAAIVSVSCPSSGDCNAVTATGSSVHSDGSVWTATPAVDLPTGASLTGVSCTSASACVAVGDDPTNPNDIVTLGRS